MQLGAPVGGTAIVAWPVRASPVVISCGHYAMSSHCSLVTRSLLRNCWLATDRSLSGLSVFGCNWHVLSRDVRRFRLSATTTQRFRRPPV